MPKHTVVHKNKILSFIPEPGFFFFFILSQLWFNMPVQEKFVDKGKRFTKTFVHLLHVAKTNTKLQLRKSKTIVLQILWII